MNGQLAELICLATHGTRWLAQQLPVPVGFERANSTFQFVASTEFVLGETGRLGQPERASTVADWVANCRAAGASRIWLFSFGLPSRVDEHARAGFTSNGQWGLALQTPEGAQVWFARWIVADREAADRRIWAVRYNGTRIAAFNPQRPDLRQAQRALREALHAVKDFAEEQTGLDMWVDWFGRALDGGDEPAYHPDMLPDQLDPQARTLVAMASRAWVFGGTGSWNDVRFEGDAGRYERLTRQLYDAVLTAFLAGVNSTVVPLNADGLRPG